MAAREEHRALAWYVVGVPTGMLGLHYGVGGLTLLAIIANPMEPPEEKVPVGRDRECFLRGYASRPRSKNALAAFAGGTTGFAITLFLVFSLYL